MTGDISGYHIGIRKESYRHLDVCVKGAAEWHTVDSASPLQGLICSNAQTEPRLRNSDPELERSLEPPRSRLETHCCFGGSGARPKRVHF